MWNPVGIHHNWLFITQGAKKPAPWASLYNAFGVSIEESLFELEQENRSFCNIDSKHKGGLMSTGLTKYSTWQLAMLITVRVAVGWHLLYEGLVKLYTPGWSSAEYLVMSRWIFAGFFNWIASNPVLLQIVDFINVWGLMR